MSVNWTELLLGAGISAVVAIPITLALSDPISDVLSRLTGGVFVSDEQFVFAGSWDAIYSRCDAPGPEESEVIVLRQLGRTVIGRRLNESSIRLSGRVRQARYVTGIWYDTKPNRRRFGAFQFVMQDGEHMVGRWVGFSTTHNDLVRHGEWNLRRHGSESANVRPHLRVARTERAELHE